MAVPEGALGDVAGVDHRMNPRQGVDRGGVDAQDPGMGMRAALDGTDQQPAQFQVIGIDGAPRDLVGSIKFRDPLAHHCVVGLRVSTHGPASMFQYVVTCQTYWPRSPVYAVRVEP